MNIKQMSSVHIGELPLFRLKATTAKSQDVWLLVFVAATVLLLLYRLFLMWILPLADTTEARYGEIARLTLTHGFWLMPHIDMDTPFFAKPPLSTWAASVSMFIFGVTEFAARLPSLLAAIVAAWTAVAFASAFKVKKTWLVFPVMASCPLFFISAGAVMTDAIQMCVVSAALYFAWRAIEPETEANRDARRRWRLAFWTMVGIGALCKGLANWALIGMPLIAYAVIARKPVEMFKQIFDWLGLAIAVCIFMPWYAAAEYYNPGFLNYFIVGEHFSRFLVPAWKGDRYGIAHVQPLGTIWIFWIAAIFPWLGVFVSQLFAYLRRKSANIDALERFLWCATLTPLVFFTFAHNIIWTYGLTSIVPFAVLVVRWMEHASSKTFRFTSMGVFAFAIVSVLCASLITKNMNGNSDRELVSTFNKQSNGMTPLVYRTKPWYSSSFYTHGNFTYQPDQSKDALQKAGNDPVFEVVDNSSVGSNKIYFHGTRHSLVLENRN